MVQSTWTSAACVIPIHGHAGMVVGFDSIQNDICGMLSYIDIVIHKEVPWADVARLPKSGKPHGLTGASTEELTHGVMWILRAEVGRSESKCVVTIRLSACPSQIDLVDVCGVREAARINFDGEGVAKEQWIPFVFAKALPPALELTRRNVGLCRSGVVRAVKFCSTEEDQKRWLRGLMTYLARVDNTLDDFIEDPPKWNADGKWHGDRIHRLSDKRGLLLVPPLDWSWPVSPAPPPQWEG